MVSNNDAKRIINIDTGLQLTDGRTEERTNGQMNRRTDRGGRDRGMVIQMERLKDRKIDRQTGGWIVWNDKQMNRRTDKWTDGQTSGQTSGQTNTNKGCYC